ncbi:GTPase LSG1-2 isoform X2 [Spinacia oleracea]|uniref:GTPase LSG1-2 isoform X2 n=1 Tax=Spinacia oleracea TaxID=3562 RepID=A0A9R0K543_SPIOL|nr:GTPase LSG1-2 isoform X2 [Spinacia oleracea]
MGKGEKTGLGRALVKHHNQVVQETKEKGRFYKTHNKKALISVTDVSDIDAVIEQADEADRVFSADNPVPQILIDSDSSSSTPALTPEQRRQQQKKEEALHAGSLRVPRRPPWKAEMTVDELDVNEKHSFLSWRRGLAKLEENEKLVLTPFEKNLDIWRQLWRVVERSDLIVMVVDARNPLFYRCPDLEAYVREVDEHKRTMLLINKADLLPYSIRLKWAKYFHDHGILFVFWSAKAASAALDGKVLDVSKHMQEDTVQESEDDTKVYGRDELLARLQFEAEEIMSLRKSGPEATDSSDSHSLVRNTGVNSASNSVTVGFVGYPNVGKSSTINALVGTKRAGVTNTPGKTKHFQTLIITDKLTLCDCPGLVFPSFTSSRYEMIACGVLPIDRMTAHRDAVQVVANKVPRHVIEQVYKITLPKPKSYEPQSRPPFASELLRAYCASRGYTASSGLPDETRASRQMLKDYIDGKLMHYELPPGMSDEKNESVAIASGLSDIDESDSSDLEDSSVELEDGPNIEDVMNDLESFDLANGLATEKTNAKKKVPKAPHKLHKKPQRKKDRSWRVRNDGGDGMPLARAFQKAVNTVPQNP